MNSNNQFEALIRDKTDVELIKILSQPQNYKPDFIELAEKELKEVRHISATTYEDYVKGKTDEELKNFYISDDYSSDFVQLVEKELTERNVALEEYKAEKKRIKRQLDASRETIHGWLTWFLVSIGIGLVFSLFNVGKSFSMSDFDLESEQWVIPFGACCTIISIIAQFALAIYTIILFLNYKPNAIANGKAYVIVCFIANLLIMLTNSYETDSYFMSAPRVSRSTVWAVIWFLYLCKSEQVNTIFPREDRKVRLVDKCLWAAIFVPILIWYVLAVSVGISKNAQESAFEEKVKQTLVIEESSLGFLEHTDGRIVFKCPLLYKAEKKEIENDICYTLTMENEDSRVESSITIYSTFDNTDTQSYFEECVEGWKDASLTEDEYHYTVIDNNHRISNGNSIYQQKTFYECFEDDNPDVYWIFAAIFNKETNKCCVISCYGINEDTNLDEIIASIRFK